EMATLLKAGLPLVQSLDILRKRVPNPVFRAALNDIHDRVRSGSSLSDAFEAQQLFSAIYTASLMAGEKSGSLEQVIRRYVQHMKVIMSARSQVISALIYPVILLVLSIIVVGLIVFQVVPEFADFYAQFGQGAQLPMSTRIVVALSTNLVGSAGLVATAVVALAAAGVLWFRRPARWPAVFQGGRTLARLRRGFLAASRWSTPSRFRRARRATGRLPRTPTAWRNRCGKGRACRRPWPSATFSRTWPSKWWKW